MTYIKEIINELEKLAPPAYQESYDNAGLLVGSPEIEITGVLFTLDVTEEVIEEAVERNCNLIVAHHPIIFKGLKKLNGKNYVERTVIKAIKNDVAIYATHTNLDHVSKGVNWQIGERLGLQNMKVLVPKKQLLTKLAFFIPVENTQSVLDALFAAGAGHIGNYEHCSFRAEGTGTFLPGDAANPVIGSRRTRRGERAPGRSHVPLLSGIENSEHIKKNASLRGGCLLPDCAGKRKSRSRGRGCGTPSQSNDVSGFSPFPQKANECRRCEIYRTGFKIDPACRHLRRGRKLFITKTHYGPRPMFLLLLTISTTNFSMLKTGL
jgi:dinuclear metal center YbgI/SA1388 family protein